MTRRLEDFLLHVVSPTVLGIMLSVGVIGLSALLLVLSSMCHEAERQHPMGSAILIRSDIDPAIDPAFVSLVQQTLREIEEDR